MGEAASDSCPRPGPHGQGLRRTFPPPSSPLAPKHPHAPTTLAHPLTGQWLIVEQLLPGTSVRRGREQKNTRSLHA